MIELVDSKLKYGLFSTMVSCHDRSVQNCHNLCSKCAPCARTQAPLRRQRHWSIAASMIDWSNCTYSSIRHVLSSCGKQLLTILRAGITISQHKFNKLHVSGALYRIDEPNLRNIVVINPVLGKNLEHLHLTR